MMAKKFAFSYSHIAAFELCPKKYYNEFITKKYSKYNEANMSGVDAHKAIELYLKEDKPLPLQYSHFAKTVDKYKAMASKGDAYYEVQLALDRQLRPVGWFDKDVYVRAVVDYLLVMNNIALIVDWKTGARTSSDFTQLKLAAAVLFAAQPQVEGAALSYVFVNAGKTFSTKVTRSDAKAVWRDIIRRANRIEVALKNTEFPPTPNFLCAKYCPVTSCPHHGERHHNG